MNKSLARADTQKQAKYDELQESKKRIKDAWINSIDSMWIIGRELIRIEEDDLCAAEGKDFREYVEFDLNINFTVAQRWMRAFPVLDLIKTHHLQLPSNESQLVELAKLKEPEKLVTVWEKIVTWGTENKQPVTYDLVKEAVSAQRKSDGEYLTRARVRAKPRPKGVEIDLSNNGEVVATYSELGERALNRIRRLCGDAYADAILAENPKVSESELVRWAEEETEMVKNLGYWIVIKRWSLKKALNYEEKTIDEDTTVEQLGDLARSRGGKAFAQWQDVKITVEVY